MTEFKIYYINSNKYIMALYGETYKTLQNYIKDLSNIVLPKKYVARKNY